MVDGPLATSIMNNWGCILGNKIVDLSLSLAAGKQGFQLQKEMTIAEDGYNTSYLHIYSHALTHMDAPRHFLPDGHTMEAMKLDKCVGKALVVDLSHKEKNSFITIADLEPYAAHIIPHSRLLIRTDWDIHADKENYRTDFPRISVELAKWLVRKELWLLGVETPSVASLHSELRDELTEVHQILLGGDVVIVESLSNLKSLRGSLVQFIALPLKLDGGDGSPVRAIAIELDDETNRETTH